MNTVATIDDARAFAVRLERRERARAGKLDVARETLAREIGITPAKWRNLAQGRIKRLDVWLRDRLQALMVREIEAEIRRLEHELFLVRQSGDDLASQHVREIDAHLEAARSLLRGK